MPSKCKFDHLLICDQARREDNGKVFLIGLYTGGINVPKAPTKLHVTYWLIGDAQETGRVQFEIQTDYESESGTTSIGPKGFALEIFDIEKTNAGRDELQFGIAGVPLEIPELPGVLTVKVREAGAKKWRQLARKSVQLQPTSSSEQQQPS